jgi:hypothetical protein
MELSFYQRIDVVPWALRYSVSRQSGNCLANSCKMNVPYPASLVIMNSGFISKLL